MSCRYFLRNAAEAQASEVELFLNSVPLLNPLSQEEKLQLVDAFEEKTYKRGDKVGTGSIGVVCVGREWEACVMLSTRPPHTLTVVCIVQQTVFGHRASPQTANSVQQAMPWLCAPVTHVQLAMCGLSLMCPLLLLTQVVVEGEAGDKFYIIKEGEAVVFQLGPGGRQHKVNHLFKADFFGERALLVQEPRMATVCAACCTVL